MRAQTNGSTEGECGSGRAAVRATGDRFARAMIAATIERDPAGGHRCEAAAMKDHAAVLVSVRGA